MALIGRVENIPIAEETGSGGTPSEIEREADLARDLERLGVSDDLLDDSLLSSSSIISFIFGVALIPEDFSVEFESVISGLGKLISDCRLLNSDSFLVFITGSSISIIVDAVDDLEI